MKAKYTEYIPILETHNAGDRVFLRSLLDSEGIIYFIQNENVAPYVFNAIPMRLMVRKDQEKKAREILSRTKLSYTYSCLTKNKDQEK